MAARVCWRARWSWSLKQRGVRLARLAKALARSWLAGLLGCCCSFCLEVLGPVVEVVVVLVDFSQVLEEAGRLEEVGEVEFGHPVGDGGVLVLDVELVGVAVEGGAEQGLLGAGGL